MFWFEQLAPSKLIEDIGVNNVLSRPTSPPDLPLPGSPRALRDVLAVLADVASAVLQDNAAELYQLDLGVQGNGGAA